MEINAFHIDGYKLASKYCRPTGCHGRSAIYCEREISYRERSDLVDQCSLCSAIGINSVKYVILSIYRPNTYSRCDIALFFDKMNFIFQRLISENSQYVIAGDFNINLLSKDSEACSFMSLLEGFNATPTIFDPTRITSFSSTCIDNILTNLIDYEVAVIPSYLSDHTAQYFSFPLSFP